MDLSASPGAVRHLTDKLLAWIEGRVNPEARGLKLFGGAHRFGEELAVPVPDEAIREFHRSERGLVRVDFCPFEGESRVLADFGGNVRDASR